MKDAPATLVLGENLCYQPPMLIDELGNDPQAQ
jgi:hypothetical protein